VLATKTEFMVVTVRAVPQPMQARTDQRRHCRFPAGMVTARAAAIDIRQPDLRARPCSLANLSYGGMCFSADTPLVQGAEHHFLIFKSLANKDLALSTPNPIPKIADVAGGQGTPYLMSAVGRPLEWDHTVPYFGRHEIVKGAAYSFYEFASTSLLNDQEWIAKLPSQPRPAWVAPYVSAAALSCPARNPF